ncbi:beta-1,4-galactosyltransferase 1 [Chionomys nivalis]|uniref:beta-1,4-galactosyltransferase 1 n=1 Tax=Chionomys nivalis TaxID=269649 RepID=UPI0025921353|nr:beta-1,4-galactosyltransferase 1 [Chionomys nivalis]
MRFREPLLGGNTAMPGSSLQRACRLLVAVCALHLGVTLVYYLSGRDLSRLPQLVGVSSPFKGGTNGTAATKQPLGELRTRGARPPPPLGVSSKPRPGPSSPGAAFDPGPKSNLTSVLVPPTTALLSLPACPEESPLLVGPMVIDFNIPVDLELLAKKNPEIKMGGRFSPKDCVSPHKVAIIIPFRNRQEHLKYWLYYLHPILQRQQLDYGIYVINQAGETMFNRAKLLNIGFQEALKDYDYNCFVFSDVDLIPMDDHNSYRCFAQPRHISVAMDKFGFSLPYVQYFGGVSALSKQQFLAINGFPNNYWGWGGEDDDIFNRIVHRGMSISRPNAVVGKCRMIRHSRDKKNEPNPQRFDRIAHTKETMRFDGLNSLTYQVLEVQRYPLYTKITVDIGTPR